MASKREQILARLLDVLKAVQGAQLVERNRTSDIPETRLPALMLADGDETGADYAAPRPGAPAIVGMEPLVAGWVSAPDAEVGPAINDLLANTQRAVFNDPVLNDLCGPRGGVFQLGIDMVVEKGSRALCGFVLQLDIKYFFDPKNP